MQSKSKQGGKMLRAIKTDIAYGASAYKDLGVVGSFFSFFQGRATAFAIVFTVCGLIGFFKHYDLTSYALFCGAIFAGVVGHSLKEDYFELRHRQISITLPPVEPPAADDK